VRGTRSVRQATSNYRMDYLFTLRAIADNPELRCHGCGGSIRLSDRVYEPLLSDVGNALDEIDSAPPSFITAPLQTRPLISAVGRLILAEQLGCRASPRLILEIDIGELLSVAGLSAPPIRVDLAGSRADTNSDLGTGLLARQNGVAR
jgi:hypothetical protein